MFQCWSRLVVLVVVALSGKLLSCHGGALWPGAHSYIRQRFFRRPDMVAGGICLRASYLLTLAVCVPRIRASDSPACVWIDAWANRAPIAKRDTSAIERGPRVCSSYVQHAAPISCVFSFETSVHARRDRREETARHAGIICRVADRTARNGWKSVTLWQYRTLPPPFSPSIFLGGVRSDI